MNKTQRIYFGSSVQGNDMHVKIKLDQEVNTLEMLSLDISTEDAYRSFNSDYGVLVGRVIANDGIGVPNVKISIFIPVTDDDFTNGDITSVYPYKTPRDKNNDGKRYNLLPRVGKIDPNTGVISPKQPFGSFPIKEEIVTNDLYLNVYKKYYKYTALTNDSGDYMIFGVPVGNQIVHMSVDITDIGKYSMDSASMVVNLGYSPNLFTDNNTKIKPSSDLNDLPNIETQEINVDIVPFWGDTTNFEIGITRQDFRIRSQIKNTFTIFGSVFTDGDNSMWGENYQGNYLPRELFRLKNDANTNIGISSKRCGIITEKIYYYPAKLSTGAELTDDYIDYCVSNNIDISTEMLLLDPSEYSVYKRNGDFVIIINCNRNKIIIDELGNEVNVPSDYNGGLFTKFRGFVTLEITNDIIPMNFTGDIGAGTSLSPIRYRVKIPQRTDNYGESFDLNPQKEINSIKWRNQSFIFSGNTIYSIAKFNGLVFDDSDLSWRQESNGFLTHDFINDGTKDVFFNTGIIGCSDDFNDNVNSIYQMPSNITTDHKLFGSNWLNFSVYLPQVGYLTKGQFKVGGMFSNTNFTNIIYDINQYNGLNNNEAIADSYTNIKWFCRSDLHWTDFIVVSQSDIIKLNEINSKGFDDTNATGLTINNYRNGYRIPNNYTKACPDFGGRINGNPALSADTKTYFFKGFGDSDCIKYLFDLGIVK